MALTLHGNNGVITTNGTAAAPSFAAPDTDTGLYFGTNLIHATTSGTNRFNIDANGRVLIGLTSSTNDNTLTLQGSSGGNYNSRLELRRGGNPSNGQGLGTIYFANNAGKWGAGIYAAAAENWTSGSAHGTDLVFQTVDNTTTTLDERVRITQNGKVGIGSNNPNVYSADADNLILRTTSSTGMTIRSGSTSGGSIFFANDDNSTSNEGIFQYLHNDKAFILNNYGGGNEKFIYKNRGTEVFRITSGGTVCVGNNSSPDGKLHVYSSSAGSVTANAGGDELVLESSGNTGLSILSPGTGESTIFFGNPGTNGERDGYIRYYHEAHSTTANRRSLAFIAGGGDNERLRITSGGHIVTQGLTSYSFQNDSANAKIFEVTGDGTVGEYGAINISGNQNANNSNIGNLRFINRENTTSSSGNSNTSKQVAAIQAYIKSDGNSSNNSGGILTFHTKGQGDVNGERVRIDDAGRLLVGNFTDDIGDGTLQVYTADRKHPAIRTNSPNANGYTMFSDSYQSDESQVNFGVSYSSSSLVLSRCCKVSDAADNTYLSSQDTYNARPTALVLDNDGALRFHTTETNATTTTDSAVSLTEVFKVDKVGNIYQRISNRYMWFGASNQLQIGVNGSDPYINSASGDLQVRDAGNVCYVVRSDHLQMYMDIKMNNDKGISFINADDTASGETVSSSVLDDYEEGTFTATLKGHTDPSNTSSVNANKTATTTGRYVKVGQNVTVTMRWYNLQNNGADEMHNCQLQNIHGLPYHSNNTSTNWSASIGYQRGLYPRWSNSSVTSQAVYMYGYIEGNDDKVQLRCSQTSGPGTLYPTVHDSTTHMYMTFTLTYQSLA